MLQVRIKAFLRNFVVALLCLLLSGAGVQFKYCMGQLVKVSSAIVLDKSCNNCKSDHKSKDCCSLKQQWVKVDKAHQVKEVNQPSLPRLVVAFCSWRPFDPRLIHLFSLYSTAGNKPPPSSGGLALFIKNRTIRI
jgi:hypothetical protein